MDAIEQYKIEFEAEVAKAQADIAKLSDRLHDVDKDARAAGRSLDKVGTSGSRGVQGAATAATRASGALRTAGRDAATLGGQLATLGNRANRMTSGLTPLGTALGIGAATDLAYLAVAGIEALAGALHDLKKDAADAASALAGVNSAEGAITDAFLGSVQAANNMADARAEATRANRELTAAEANYAQALSGRVVDQAKVTSLTNQHHAALIAVRKQTIAHDAAERHLSQAIKEHGAGSRQAIDAADREKTTSLSLTAARTREKTILKELDKEKRGHKATSEEVARASDRVAQADKHARDAALQVGLAQRGVDKAAEGRAAAQAEQVRQAEKLHSAMQRLNSTVPTGGQLIKVGAGANELKAARDQAHRYADALREAVTREKGFTAESVAGAQAVADLIDKMGRVPPDIETLIKQPGMDAAQKATDAYSDAVEAIPTDAQTTIEQIGGNTALAQAKGLFDMLTALDGKTARTHISQSEAVSSVNRASGGYFPGAFDGADDIPIWVSRGEAVLNPRQISLVDSGMSVGQALAATNAPGASFMSSHRHGLDYRKAKLDLEGAIRDERRIRKEKGAGSYEDRQARLAVEQARKDFREAARAERHHDDRSVESFLGGSILDQLARASSTLDEKDDRVAARRAATRIEGILRHGSYKGRRLTRTERRALLDALGGYRRDGEEPKPDDPTGGGFEDNGALDAYLDLQRVRSVAETALGLTLGTAGDLGISTAGAGGFLRQGAATAAAGQQIVIQALHPADPATLDAISRTVTVAQGRQGYQPRARRRLGVL